MEQATLIPTLQIRDGCVILYNKSEYTGNRAKIPFKKPAYGGQVTKGVQKRIASAIDIFMQTTETKRVFNTVTGKGMDFRCGFVTLTITDYCTWTADECYDKLLRPFMRIMKEKHGVDRYIWKYELQKRGNVHYHILIDQFIAYDKICTTWNKIQHKHRLTDTYAERMGHFNPNSTDIHKVWQIKNIAAYLGKYLQKGNEKVRLFHEGFPALYYDREVKGKVWDCSTDLKRVRYSSEYVFENSDLLTDMVARKEAKIIHLDECTIVRCDNPENILTETQKIGYCLWKYNI